MIKIVFTRKELASMCFVSVSSTVKLMLRIRFSVNDAAFTLNVSNVNTDLQHESVHRVRPDPVLQKQTLV